MSRGISSKSHLELETAVRRTINGSSSKINSEKVTFKLL